jgi:molybdopterin-guanine dinucleotide biosynthesis protein
MTELIHIIGYPGAGKTIATVKLVKHLKDKHECRQEMLSSYNTKQDFKKQNVPVMVTSDGQTAWIGQDPCVMKPHRRRLAGTESLNMYQQNMIDRAITHFANKKYKRIIVDGFCMRKPAPKKAVKKLRNRKHRKLSYHVVHLTTSYTEAAKSWTERETRASKNGYENAQKALLKHDRGSKDKQPQYDVYFDEFLSSADTVTEVTRDTIYPYLKDMVD